MHNTLSFCLLMFSFLGALYGQSISEKLQAYQNSHHIEKVYISHDKSTYYPGETIWAKVFFLDGRTHTPFDAEPTLFVEWLSGKGEVLQHYNLKIKDGFSSLDIPTAKEDPAGIYILRAYSQYQKNFDPAYIFQKEIRLLGIDDSTIKEKKIDDFSVRFFPEGGHLVIGLQNRVAFKVESESSDLLGFQGKLLNEKGGEIMPLHLIHESIGIFEFTPKPNVNYTARFSYQGIEKVFPLPVALPQGFTIQCKTVTKDYIEVKLAASSSLENCTLIGHIRGQTFLSQTFEDLNAKQLLIKKESLPSGISHFTLFDDQDRPVCERLIFHRNPKEQITSHIELKNDYFLRRGKVELAFGSFWNDTLVPSNFSISVFNQDLSDSLYTGIDMVNYLLLQSDLRGRIKNIQQYFQRDDISSSVLLDLLLMTHGWRRFTWQNVLSGEQPVFFYPTQDDLTLSGRISRANSEEFVKADVSLTALSEENFMSLNLTTDDDGLFYFRGFQFEDTVDLFIQANVHNPKKQKRLKEGEIKRVGSKNIEIDLIDLNQWDLSPSTSLPYSRSKVKYTSDNLTKMNQYQKIDSAYDAQMELTLGEVSITARRSYSERNRYLQKKFKEKNLFFYASTYKVLMDDLPDKGANYMTIYDLVKKMVPRTLVQGGGVNRTIHFRRNGTISDPALILIDGVEMSRSRVQHLDPRQIEIIDVLDGLYATITYAADNVILILTREPGTYDLGYEPPKPKGVLTYQHPGYYQSREFYSPDYAQLSVNHQKPDFRTTLYWNAKGQITSERQHFTFYTGDISGKYLIKIEGLTANGLPFVGMKSFNVLE